MHISASTLAAALAVMPLALAQTSTTCDPLDTTCAKDTALDKTTFTSDFTQGASSNTSWTAEAGTTITYGANGAEFTINEEGQAPTIGTDFFFFFGTVEVVMQAANGTGIVSSVVLESDDLDEIDLEFLGGDTTQVETNYFGKGNTTTYNRAIYYDVTDPQSTFHTYTIDWTTEYIKFSIDGTVVRTLTYDEADGGASFPQTPMKVKLGNWAGGASDDAAGTVEWAGGETDFSDAPFTMYVKSVSITNSYPAAYYDYTDKTGDWQSIEIIQSDGSTSYASNSTSASSSSSSTSSSSSSSSVSSSKSSTSTSTSTSASSTSSQTVKVAADATKSASTISTTVSSKASSSSGKADKTTTSSSTSTGLSAAGAVDSSSSANSTANSTASSTSTGSSTNSSSTSSRYSGGASSNSAATGFVVICSIAFALMVL